jgi:hypothetical protein
MLEFESTTMPPLEAVTCVVLESETEVPELARTRIAAFE